MKINLTLFLAVIVVLVSCNKKEDNEISINVSTLTNKWWEIKCIDLDQSHAQTTIIGGLDYGKFYFNSNGTYTRKTDSPQLEICHPIDSVFTYVINSSSGSNWGIPFGEIYGFSTDSIWTINSNIITINQWGSWQIIEQNNSRITLKSSRTNYLYEYTIIEE
ncbi:MAG: hypothetical protein K8R58_01450 [Bacteroidales bacterium]|nr:hypothetical protein [Bacteroidales bacterium]